MDSEQLSKALMTMIVANQPTFIWGPAGIGKSDIMKQVSARYGAIMSVDAQVEQPDGTVQDKVALLMDDNPHLIDIRASQLDPTDVRGLPCISGNYAKWLPPDEFPRKDRDPDHGVVFLDELPDATPLVKGALYRLCLDRTIGDYRLPDGWVVMAAGNRQQDGGLYQRMPLPLMNRFTHIDFDVSLDCWISWALPRLEPEIVQYIRWRPESLHRPPTNDSKEKAFPTPRSYEFASRILKTMKKVGVNKEIELEIFKGTIGEAEAVELVGFLRIFRELPNPDAILLNPSSADIPDKPEILYALVGALSHKASKDNAGRIIQVADKMPTEFNVMLIRDSVAKSKDFQKAPEFMKWATENHDVLI